MTYVYETLNINQIARYLSQDEYASWHKNYAACEALAEYLDNLASDGGEPIELDIVALRCEFSLWDNLEEFQKEYGDKYKTIEDIQDETTVIMVDDTSFIAGDM